MRVDVFGAADAAADVLLQSDGKIVVAGSARSGSGSGGSSGSGGGLALVRVRVLP